MIRFENDMIMTTNMMMTMEKQLVKKWARTRIFTKFDFFHLSSISHALPDLNIHVELYLTSCPHAACLPSSPPAARMNEWIEAGMNSRRLRDRRNWVFFSLHDHRSSCVYHQSHEILFYKKSCLLRSLSPNHFKIHELSRSELRFSFATLRTNISCLQLISDTIIVVVCCCCWDQWS